MLCLAYGDCDARADWELGLQWFDYDLLASVDLHRQALFNNHLEMLMLRVACIISVGAKASWVVETIKCISCAYA